MKLMRASGFTTAEHDRWDELWTAYLEFYDAVLPAETHAATWARVSGSNGPLYGLGVRSLENGTQLVGITHYLFHVSAWTATEICYLQDLYVDPGYRRCGIARMLIEDVAAAATARGASKLYWTTQESNLPARLLYDTVAKFNGFIRYDMTLPR